MTEPPTLTWEQRAQLRDAIEASDLPFRVDVVEAQDLHGAFAERVKREMVPLDETAPPADMVPAPRSQTMAH